MTNGKLANPFIYQGYESPAYFCDRLEETAALLSHLRNGRNVTLISARRIGKTGLIKNTFYHLKEEDKGAVCLYLDIFATKNLRDFVEAFAEMTINGFIRKNESIAEKAAGFLGSLRPVLSLNPVSGETHFSVRVEQEQEEPTVRSLFDCLNGSGKEIYIAIDEFQQIAEYPESGTEAMLRSYIQFTQHIHFIFSGSKHHLMSEIFGSPKHPFYQSTEMMGLKPLDENVYYDFCRKFFHEKGGELSQDAFAEIYRRFEGHTWYIQCIMNRLYEEYDAVDNVEQVNSAIAAILGNREPQYESMVQFFTENQMSVLKAIAEDGIVSRPLSGQFIKRHRLPGASSVKAALKVLEDKEIIYHKTEGYVIYDRFMALWFRGRL